MAKLIKCKACGNQIAKDAKTCPQCGAKNKKRGGCGVIVLVLLVLFAVGIMATSKTSSSEPAVKAAAKENAAQLPAGNSIIMQALAYLKTEVKEACRVEFTGYDVFISFAGDMLPNDYKIIANAAAVNGSRALVEARETPSRCSVWIIPASAKAGNVDTVFYSAHARNGKVQ